ncbi:unnamed protein product [Dracunculus medinensis]|uniref:Endoplasmic reticulum lectin 1 n=1 Tax=Dracunculus medinensis TaxID=318479 RepID=A0A3P7Q6G3_DRAME|nr:unnamed protein product [Dracunculus medinensis]
MRSDIPDSLLSTESMNRDDRSFIQLASKDDENYFCSIPFPQIKNQMYRGPSPNELLQSLYTEFVCSYWLDLYWTYELCHGRYILQYHNDGKEIVKSPRSEFYLGYFRREASKLDDKLFDHFNPPIRKIDNKEGGYYPVTYRQGTVCDLTGKPRETVVIYVCKENAKDQIYSIAEISSCSYEIIVLTKRLCLHPSFQPKAPTNNEVVCYATDSEQKEATPTSLLALEFELANVKEKEYSLMHLQKDFDPSSSEMKDYGSEDIEHESSIQKILLKPTSTDGVIEKISHESRNSVSIFDEVFIKYFLSGKHCLYGGGTGWWKYEFCYGKSVIQFHEDINGRTEIVLGVFNEIIHKQWIKEVNSGKHILKLDGKILQVIHFYAGGDICEDVNIARSVEVRIRCRESFGSQTAVTLYLLEPHTCNYVLSVESPRFCALLQEADEYGLIKFPEERNKT